MVFTLVNRYWWGGRAFHTSLPHQLTSRPPLFSGNFGNGPGNFGKGPGDSGKYSGESGEIRERSGEIRESPGRFGKILLENPVPEGKITFSSCAYRRMVPRVSFDEDCVQTILTSCTSLDVYCSFALSNHVWFWNSNHTFVAFEFVAS